MRVRPDKRSMSDLTVRDWADLVIALRELLCARLEFGFRSPASIINQLRNDTFDGLSTGNDKDEVSRVSWALGAVAARVPWRADCLIRCMAAHRWLKNRRLKPEFFLGAKLDEQGSFQAHAWLRCKGQEVCGGSGAGFVHLIAPRSGGHPKEREVREFRSGSVAR